MMHININQLWAQLPVWSLRLWDEERWGTGTSPKPTTSFGSCDGLCSALFFQPSPFRLQLVFIHEENAPKKPPSPLLPLLAWGLWVLLESLQSFGSPSKVPTRPLTSEATWGQGTIQDSHSGRALFGSISQPLHQSQRNSFDPNHDLCCLSWADDPIVLSEKRHPITAVSFSLKCHQFLNIFNWNWMASFLINSSDPFPDGGSYNYAPLNSARTV